MCRYVTNSKSTNCSTLPSHQMEEMLNPIILPLSTLRLCQIKIQQSSRMRGKNKFTAAQAATEAVGKRGK